MDKLKAMSIFVEIAEFGSLTGAAKDMGKSLPSVVIMMDALEKHLEVQIFNRTICKYP